jgi:hypothetical protein
LIGESDGNAGIASASIAQKNGGSLVKNEKKMLSHLGYAVSTAMDGQEPSKASFCAE